MPSTRKNGLKTSIRDRLVEDLSKALVSERSRRGAWIVVSPVNRLGKVDVNVTWDRWVKLSFEERSAIILDAWEKANPGRREDVYLASGRTRREALALGHLPYYIEPVAADEVDEELERRIHDAMVAEGAFETLDGLQARFESFEQAKQSLVTLRDAIPEVDWLIVKEVAVEG